MGTLTETDVSFPNGLVSICSRCSLGQETYGHIIDGIYLKRLHVALAPVKPNHTKIGCCRRTEQIPQ